MKFERICSAKVFTKLELCEAYSMVRNREANEWKTVFGPQYRYFEYLIVPFGLCNSLETFQHVVNEIFRDIWDCFIVIYLDDVFSKSQCTTFSPNSAKAIFIPNWRNISLTDTIKFLK